MGAPILVGPEAKFVVAKKEDTKFGGSDDCVFVFQVVRIKSKMGDKFK